MKRNSILPIFAILFIGPVLARGQGSFQNLDFESAMPGNTAPGPISVASALPYWNVYYSGAQQTQMEYNQISTGATWVILEGSGDEYVKPIDGNYSVLIQGIAPGSTAAISQTGLIPAGTETMLFKAQWLSTFGGPYPLELSIGSQTIPFAAVFTGNNYTLYSANLSAWQDETEQLTFSVPGGNYNGWELDDISFETTPEPDSLILTAMGGAILGFCRRFKKKKERTMKSSA